MQLAAVRNLLFNQFLSTLAPSDVHTLSIKEAPTTKSALENEKPGPLLPLNNETLSTSDAGEMSSGDEPEGSDMQLRDLSDSVNVTATTISLPRLGPDEVFDSFLVESTAPSAAAQPNVTKLSGSLRTAEIEGQSSYTHYNTMPQGLVEGMPSLPLSSFIATVT